jgi:hypothetical protein
LFFVNLIIKDGKQIMEIRKSCGITTNSKENKIVVFHGKKQVSFSIDDFKSLDKAQDLLWEIANDAQTVGENRAQEKIKKALGLKD